MNIKITEEQNKLGFCSIIASILYYEKEIGNDFSAKEILSKITDKFWIEEGFMNSNMNRSKMVFDLCEKYNIPNNGFDDIHKYMRNLYRPEYEINSIYKQLQACREEKQ